MEAPVLYMPDQTKPFILETDALKHASGAVLRQQDSNGDWHPCRYLSKSFTETEQNYDIGNRELLAVIRALEEWRHYLLGSLHEVILLSDHKNLGYFKQPQKLNPRQARWNVTLSQYNLKLVHIPGTKMVQSNALSRQPNLCLKEDNDNENVTLLPEQMFIRSVDTDLWDLIAQTKNQDRVIVEALEALKICGTLPMQ